MSFGRKGLTPGSAAAAPAPGGFGRAKPADPRIGAASAAPSGGLSLEKKLDPDELAAKREAFIASERARRAQEEGLDAAPAANDPMSGLHNSSRPAARPAQPLGTGPVGENGLTEEQEKQIRETARGMAEGGRSTFQPSSRQRQASGNSGSAGRSGSQTFLFGHPQSRTLVLAYLLWFVLGQISAHRFYCGQKETAIMQFAMLVGSFVILFIFPPLGMVGIVGWMIWIFADLFLMPGMLKSFQEKHSYTGAFA